MAIYEKLRKKIPQSKKYASIIDYVNYGIHQFGEHKYCYDFEKIELLLKSIGFKNIYRDDFYSIEDLIDHKDHSIFVEATK